VHLSANGIESLQNYLIYLYDTSIGNVMRAFRIMLEQLRINEVGRAEIVMLIPDNMVSLIIGKGGRQIFKFQSRSNTEISVLDGIKEMRERQVSISGRFADICQAVEDIYGLVLSKRLKKKEAEPTNEVTSIKFVIPANSTGNVIGRGGAFTKHFRTEFKVEIKVVKGQSPLCEEDECIVVLRGRPMDCFKALENLVTHISEAIRNTSEISKDSTKFLLAPTQAKKLQSTTALKDIAYKTHTNIEFLPDRQTGQERDTVLMLSGQLELRVEAAKQILATLEDLVLSFERPKERSPKREVVEPVKTEYSSEKYRDTAKEEREKRSEGKRRRSRDYSYERRDSRDRGRRRSSSSQGSPRTDVCMTVPDELVGRLIGKNGDNVKGIMGKSGCTIKFQKSPCRDLRTPEGGSARLCTVTGSASRIAKGVRILLENISKLETDRQDYKHL